MRARCLTEPNAKMLLHSTEATTPRVQMSVSAANFGHQVNVSAHLAARNFSYAKTIEISNFDDAPLKCRLVLEAADDMTVVGKPSNGGHFQLFEPSKEGSVMVAGSVHMDVSLPASGSHSFNLGFCPFGNAPSELRLLRV